MCEIEPYDAEPIKMEPATKQDSIFVKIPVSCVHFSDPDKEEALRGAEKNGQVNIAPLQAKIQDAADRGAFDISL